MRGHSELPPTFVPLITLVSQEAGQSRWAGMPPVPLTCSPRELRSLT